MNGAGPLLKVCGATSTVDVALLAGAGADVVGLWHGIPGGRAELPVDEVATLAGAARGAGVEPMLVTFAKDPELLADVLRATGIRWVQLHAYQLPGMVGALHAAAPDELTVVKVLHVHGGGCLARPLIPAYERAGTDLFLLDSLADDGQVGSTGHQLDAADALAIADRVNRPFLLAGGLTAANREDFASVTAHPHYAGIDVDTAARDTAGRFDAAAVTAIARAWDTRHARDEVA